MQDFERVVRDAFRQIKEDKTKNYLNQPIPCELDTKVRTVIDLFLSASSEQRRVMLSHIIERDSGALIAFSERMAALGARESSRQRLLEGLIALVLENYSTDWRDVILRMAPLYHAAVRIGIDAEELFAEAASYAVNDVARDIAEFPKRKAENRTLEAFGYREVFEPDGIRYRWF